MIINNIVIENVGLLGGRQEFNLVPRVKYNNTRPIIIFGGNNGAGKTTLFDAILLCLYGQGMFPAISQAKYNQYLKKKIHYSKNLIVQPSCASIEIELEYVKVGQKHTFQISRSWCVRNNKIFESLDVKKDGVELDDIEKDSWQDFIKELIPSGLAQLFFFDGEKIQKIMSNSGNLELKSSIKSLIGLDLVERLKSDLKLYKNSLLKEEGRIDLKVELEAFEKNQQEIEIEIQKRRQRLANLENKVLRKREQLVSYENKMAAQGGGFAQKRTELIEERKTIEKEIEIINEKLRELAAGLLPVTIAKTLAINLKKQIHKEQERHSIELASSIIQERTHTVLKKLDSDLFWSELDSIKDTRIEQIRNNMKDTILATFDLLSIEDDGKIIFGFSRKQSENILYDIERGTKEISKRLEKLNRDLEQNHRRLQLVINNIQKAPEDSLIQPMFTKLGQLNQDLGAIETEVRSIEDNISSLQIQLNEASRNISKIEDKLSETTKKRNKIELINKSEEIITEYQKLLEATKISHLQDEFTSLFNQLHRKKDLISRVSIDLHSFDVSLYDERNKQVHKDMLSAGETEIYSIAMLWSLARLSGRNLPFIIDTPLGRLDSEHKKNLIEHFFPQASHQVIIFSTDSEFDKEYYKQLSPFISHAYHLSYDREKGQTTSSEGYFWK